MSETTSLQEQANKIYSEISGSLSTAVGTGTWYQPTAGLDQVIYPNQTPEGKTGVTYYPFYELADSYVAYNPNGASNLAYLSANESDPIDNGGSGVVVQGTGLHDIIAGVYGSVINGLSADDQKDMAGYKAKLSGMSDDVATQLEASFKSTGDYDIVEGSASQNKFFSAYEETGDGMTLIRDSLSYLINNLAAQGNSFKTGSAMYVKQMAILGNDEGTELDSSKLKDINLRNEFASWAIDYILPADEFTDLGTQFNSSYGPYVTDGRESAPQWSNPWNNTIYALYSDPIKGMLSDAGQGYSKEYAKISKNVNTMNNAINYLNDYSKLSSAGSDTTAISTGIFNSVVEGFNNAPKYAIPYTSSALSGAQSGNKVSFELSTQGDTSATSATTSSSTVDWGASAGYSGWGFGASVSNSGSKTSSEAWSNFDSTANNLSITSEWDSVTSKTIGPAPSWFLDTAINQAWSSGMTADSIDFQGGWAFISPDQANQYVTGSLYYIDGIAYGDPSNTITGNTSTENGATQSSFDSFQQTTTASAGFRWGPYSAGGSSSYSTSNSDSSSSSSFNSSDGSFTIVNKPLTGLESLSYTGSPSALVGISVKSIGQAIDPIAPGVSSSSARTNSKKTLAVAHGEIESSKNKPFNLEGKTVFFSNDDDASHDHIIGGQGRQTVYGLSGKETIDLGRGKDSIWTGTGRSKVTGGRGSDVIHFRKDTVAKEAKAFTKLMDWAEKDGLAFNGYYIDEITVEGVNGGKNSTLQLDGERVAKFMGVAPDLLQTMVEDAHYSVYM